MSAFWSIFIAGIFLVWAAAEAVAVHTGRQTLSAYVWSITVAFPLLPFLFGALIGGLGVHFWWFGEASCFSGTIKCAQQTITPSLTTPMSSRLELWPLL